MSHRRSKTSGAIIFRDAELAQVVQSSDAQHMRGKESLKETFSGIRDCSLLLYVLLALSLVVN